MKRYAVLLLFASLVPRLALAQSSPGADAPAVEEPAVDGPAVDHVAEARRGLESGDLISAGTALDRGLGLPLLTPDELVALYELRALLAYADDRLGMLEESLEALATLGAATPSVFPPPLRTRYEEVRADALPIALVLELVTEVEDGRRTARAVPRASAGGGNLVRALSVLLGVDDAELAPVSEDEVIDLGDPHRVVEVRYVIEALGPGGSTVASRGTADAPDLATLDALPVDQTFLHVAIATVASVLIVGAVALGMAYLATDGFTAGQPTTIGPVTCGGASCAPLLSF